jgi:TonB family protein
MVFINEKDVPGSHLPAILAHEEVHIRQGHTLDLLFSELLSALFWFNPVIWLAGRELRAIHEYLADKGVLRRGFEQALYRNLILEGAIGIHVSGLGNNFNVSLLNKRLIMMTKSRTSKLMAGKYLIALPVVVLIAFFMSAKAEPLLLSASSSGLVEAADTLEKTVFKTNKKRYEEIFSEAEVMPQFSGGPEDIQHFFQENINYPEEAIKKRVTGTVFVTFIVNKDGTITNIKILKGIGAGCDEEVLRVVKMMPKWTPGKSKGEPVNVIFNIPVKFVLDKDKKTDK